MLRPSIPGSFGFALYRSILTISDDVRTINNDDFLLVTQTVHFALQPELIFTNVAKFVIAAANLTLIALSIFA